MRPSFTEISEKARELSDADKLALVDELMRQLDIPDERVHNCWEAEVGRRIRADNTEPLESVSYESVMQKYRIQ